MAVNRERDLLFAILAVRLGKAAVDKVTDAARQWAEDPARRLPKDLVEAGAMSEDDAKLIWTFVRQAVRCFDDDKAAALEAFGGAAYALAVLGLSAAGADVARGDREPAGPPKGLDSSARAVDEWPGRYNPEGRTRPGRHGTNPARIRRASRTGCRLEGAST